MLMVPAFSATSSPDEANSSTTAAMAAFRQALSLETMSASAEKKLPISGPRTRRREGSPAGPQIQDGGWQQHCQHEHALHHIGNTCGHARRAQEAGAGAQAAEQERDEDQH